MAIEELGIKIDASAAQRAYEALRRFVGIGREAETTAEGVGRGSKKAAAGLDGLAASTKRAADGMTLFSRVFKAVFAVEALQRIVGAADAYANLTARLSLVTTSSESLARVQGRLYALAQENRSALGETVDLYTSLARSVKGLGASETQLIAVTDVISKAMVVSGTSAAAAAGGLRQLGQAFASGVLRGDEFNSVFESMPRVIELIAKGMGKTVGEMRALAAEGKLTSQVILPALLSQQQAITAEFERMPLTAGAGFQRLGNAITKLIGDLDKAAEGTSTIGRIASNAARLIEDPGKYFDQREFTRKVGAMKGEMDSLTVVSKGLIDKINELTPSVEAGFPNAVRKAAFYREELAKVVARIQEVNEELKKLANTPGPSLQGPSGQDQLNDAVAGHKARQDAAKKTFLQYKEQFKDDKTKFAELSKIIQESGTIAGESKRAILELIAAAKPKSLDAASDKAARDAETARKRLAAVEEQFAKKDLSADLANIQRNLRDQTNAYQNAEQRLEAIRQAGQVGTEEYYAARQLLIDQDAKSQKDARIAETERLDEEEQIVRARTQAAIKAGGVRVEEEKRLAGELANITRQRADNVSELKRIEEDAATKSLRLEKDRVTQLKKTERAHEDAQEAAFSYYASLVEGQQRQLSGLGKGDEYRQRLAGLQQIDEKYSQQLVDLNRERANATGDEQRNALDEQIKAIQSYHKRAIDEYDAFWDELQAKQRSASTGADEAVNNYISRSKDMATSVGNLYETTFSGIENNIADLVVKGKASFRALSDAIIAELTKILVRKAIANLLMAITGSGPGGSAAFTASGNDAIRQQAFAKGGVFTNQVVTQPTAFRFANGAGFSPGLMGEAGPEAVMPLKRGRDGKLGVEGGGQMVLNNNLTINGGAGDMPNERELQRIMQRSALNALQEAKMRGARQ